MVLLTPPFAGSAVVHLVKRGNGGMTIYEDFTTFTEVDVGANRIQKTANHVDHHAYRNESTYLYKDYGSAHFGDFTHKIKVRSNGGASGHGALWMLANNIGELKALKDSSYNHIFLFGFGTTFYLREVYGGLNYSDSMSFTANTWYYVKIVKSGTSLNAYVYSDDTYTTLLDTLTLTLHTNHTFRYLYGCNTYNSGDTYNAINDIENFDFCVRTKASSAGLRIVERHTKASSVGLSISTIGTSFLDTPVDKSLSALNAWTDIDVSTNVSPGASGAIFQIINTNAGNDYKYGIRKKGSTDDRFYSINPDTSLYAIIGIDANGKCQAKIDNTSVDYFLIGYTKEDATFFTNAHDKSQTTLGAWTELDLSSELPVGAVTAIFQIVNLDLDFKSFGLRKKGSTDDRYSDLCGLAHDFFMVGVDTNRKCQFKIESTDIDFYLVGYLTRGATETNGINQSLSTTGSYIDITESNAPDGSTGVFVQCYTTDISKNYAVRKKGMTWDKYYLPQSCNTMLLVGLDENKKWQGKIENTITDFYTLGYFAGEVITKTKASSIGVTIQETNTKASSIGVAIPETNTKASSIGLRIVNQYTKASSIGVTIQETNTKASSIGISVQETKTKSSSIGLSVIETTTKASSIGLYIIESPYEDFTTFTEVDIGANRIQKTANHIDHEANLDETTYVYKDYGAAYFGNFTHKIKWRIVSGTTDGQAFCWELANDVGSIEDLQSASKTFITFYTYISSGQPNIYIREYYGGSLYSDSNAGGFSYGDWIYAKLVKSGTSLTVYLYSDSSYSILVDTLVLTLHADHSFKYLYGCNTRDLGVDKPVVHDIENFDLSDDAVTKISTIGVSVQETNTKASSIGVSIQEINTKASSIGLSVQETNTKASSIGVSIQEINTKASSIGMSIKIEEGHVSILGITITNRFTKQSSIGISVIGANTKESSIGVSILEQKIKASSVGLSIIEQKVKASSVGMHVVVRETKASSVSLTVFDTPVKNSSIGLDIKNIKTKESSIGMFISGYNTKESSIGLHIYEPACTKGLFYGKLGDTILEAIDPESFRISEEINKIPSFEFEVANSEVNRTAIAANPTALFKIYWQHHGIENHIFTGIINADGIEYVSLTNIRITGFSSYVKLGWPLFKHLNAEDAEQVNAVFDFHGTYTDYTTQANNATINDVLVTLGGVNHCLYVGEANPFWGLQIKYSTSGISAGANIIIEYSKGSGIWAELNVLDGTYAFTEAAGTYDFIIAHPPSDWARNTINGISKFWLRWRVVSGAYTTSPKLDQIHTVNVDVYRVFYLATSARAILLDVLEGTEYTMDAIDVCPEDEINIFAEYESPLRVVAAIPAALTWTDGDGNKKAYQWWIDEAKKVHIKKKRGTTHSDDITGDLTIFNNLIDYFNVSNRLIGFSKRDGLSQIRAIVEDRTSQTTHALREFPVPKTDLGKYITLKEGLEKDIAISKDPMQRLKGSVTTEFWGKRGYNIGDTVTLHQGEWIVEEGEFQIVKVERGPLLTQLNLGISREHLEGLKSNLKRTFDLSNVQMHGSTTIFAGGPETTNYERKANGDVYSAKLKLDMPNDVKKTHKMLLSWTIGPYRASVNDTTAEIPGHDHNGFAGAGGAHAGGDVGAGGAFIPDIELDGGFTPEMLGEAHIHDLSNTLAIDFGEIYINSADADGTVYGLNHRHSGGGTGYPDDTAEALIPPLYMGSSCASGRCVTGVYDSSFATGSHYHQNYDTGYTNPNAYIETNTISVIFTIHPYVLQIPSDPESPAHIHDGVFEYDHDHLGVYEPTHSDHSIPAEPAHSDHIIITEPGTSADIDYGIHEEAAGTTLELLIDGEKIGEYIGDQTEIRIDGFISGGYSSTIEIQPVAAELSKKGSATIWTSGILFIEPKRF